MKTKQELLKKQIIAIVRQSGLPVRTQYIVDRVALPEDAVLNDLLAELVAEQRLIRYYTLLSNGEPDYTYNLRA
jgi:hypothetical protein